MRTQLILIIIKICYMSVSPADHKLLGHQNGYQKTSPCLVWLILSTSPWRPAPWPPPVSSGSTPCRAGLPTEPSALRGPVSLPAQAAMPTPTVISTYSLPLNSTSAYSPCANLKLIHYRAIELTKAKRKAYVCVLIFTTWQKKNILWLFTSYFQQNTFVCVYKREYDIIN